MPQFFFDVECDDLLAGRATASLPDIESAEQYAKGFADTIMGTPRSESKQWRVSIKTDRGKVIQVVTPDHD